MPVDKLHYQRLQVQFSEIVSQGVVRGPLQERPAQRQPKQAADRRQPCRDRPVDQPDESAAGGQRLDEPLFQRSPKDDAEDYALPVWAGVLPLESRYLAPEADPAMTVDAPVPSL